MAIGIKEDASRFICRLRCETKHSSNLIFGQIGTRVLIGELSSMRRLVKFLNFIMILLPDGFTSLELAIILVILSVY